MTAEAVTTLVDMIQWFARPDDLREGELLSRLADGSPPEVFFAGLTLPEHLRVLESQLQTVQFLRVAAGAFRVGVNVSSAVLADDFGRRALVGLAARYPGGACFEFSEAAPLPPPADVGVVVGAVHAAGHVCAFDDFGEGFFREVGLLSEYRLDVVKVSRSSALASLAQPDLGFLGEVGRAAREQGMSVVVEGVEVWEDVRRLQDAGFPVHQTFAFHRPEPLSYRLEPASRPSTMRAGTPPARW